MHRILRQVCVCVCVCVCACVELSFRYTYTNSLHLPHLSKGKLHNKTKNSLQYKIKVHRVFLLLQLSACLKQTQIRKQNPALKEKEKEENWPSKSPPHQCQSHCQTRKRSCRHWKTRWWCRYRRSWQGKLLSLHLQEVMPWVTMVTRCIQLIILKMADLSRTWHKAHWVKQTLQLYLLAVDFTSTNTMQYVNHTNTVHMNEWMLIH